MENSIAMEARPGKPAQAGEGSGAAPQADASQKRRFPSARDTAERRRRMAAFIRGMGVVAGVGGIAEASRRMVKKWFDRHRRLLI
jgi:hypothetical protein